MNVRILTSTDTRQGSFGVVLLVGGLLFLSGCSGARGARSQSPDSRLAPEAIVRALLAAIDRADLDAAMSLLHPRFAMRTWEGATMVSREGYAEILGWDFVVHGERSVERFEVEDTTVTLRVSEQNRLTELLGLAPFRMDVRYEVGGGQIMEQRLRELREPGTPSYTERFTAAVEPVLAWAARAAPALLARATNDGMIHYDAASAEALLELIRLHGARGAGGEGGV